MFKKLRIRWALRKCTEPEVREMLTLLILAGRRVTHDLGHAISDLRPDSFLTDRLHAKHEHWMKVFYPDDGSKNYRSRLHYELNDAYARIEQLEKLCREKGIDPADRNAIPF